MKINVTLLTTVSVVAFLSATQVFAKPTLAKPAFSSSDAAFDSPSAFSMCSSDSLRNASKKPSGHINVSIDGSFTQARKFNSIFNVVNGTNAAPPVYTDSSPFTLLGRDWLFTLSGAFGYTFENGADITFSYLRMGNKFAPTSTQSYDSYAVLLSNSGGGYTGTGGTAVEITTTAYADISNTNPAISAGDPLNIGVSFTGRALAVYAGASTVSEASTFLYQEANADWGYTFPAIHGFYFHPYVGVAWRRIAYKDAMTFTTTSTTASYFADTQTLTSGGIYVGVSPGTPVADSGGSNDLNGTVNGGIIDGTASTGSTADTFYVNQNNASTLSNSANYIGDNLPSYTSKFSGVGPRFGLDAMYAFGKHFGVLGGVGFSLPYARQKVSGQASVFYTENLQTAGQVTTNELSTGTLLTDSNLRVLEAGAGSTAAVGTATSYSISTNKLIPEGEFKIGFRVSNDITQHNETYFLEVGYRMIQAWRAFKQVNIATQAGQTGPITDSYTNTTGPIANKYGNMSNFGPYLKLSVSFPT